METTTMAEIGPCETCGKPGTCLFRWHGEDPPGRPFCDECCDHDGGCTKSPFGQLAREEVPDAVYAVWMARERASARRVSALRASLSAAQLELAEAERLEGATRTEIETLLRNIDACAAEACMFGSGGAGIVAHAVKQWATSALASSPGGKGEGT